MVRLIDYKMERRVSPRFQVKHQGKSNRREAKPHEKSRLLKRRAELLDGAEEKNGGRKKKGKSVDNVKVQKKVEKVAAETTASGVKLPTSGSNVIEEQGGGRRKKGKSVKNVEVQEEDENVSVETTISVAELPKKGKGVKFVEVQEDLEKVSAEITTSIAELPTSSSNVLDGGRKKKRKSLENVELQEEAEKVSAETTPSVAELPTSGRNVLDGVEQQYGRRKKKGRSVINVEVQEKVEKVSAETMPSVAELPTSSSNVVDGVEEQDGSRKKKSKTLKTAASVAELPTSSSNVLDGLEEQDGGRKNKDKSVENVEVPEEAEKVSAEIKTSVAEPQTSSSNVLDGVEEQDGGKKKKGNSLKIVEVQEVSAETTTPVAKLPTSGRNVLDDVEEDGREKKGKGVENIEVQVKVEIVSAETMTPVAELPTSRSNVLDGAEEHDCGRKKKGESVENVEVQEKVEKISAEVADLPISSSNVLDGVEKQDGCRNKKGKSVENVEVQEKVEKVSAETTTSVTELPTSSINALDGGRKKKAKSMESLEVQEKVGKVSAQMMSSVAELTTSSTNVLHCVEEQDGGRKKKGESVEWVEVQEKASKIPAETTMSVAELPTSSINVGNAVEESDADKVKETLRLFNKLYLHFVQEEEEHRCIKALVEQNDSKTPNSKTGVYSPEDDTKHKAKRPDLKAISKMMEMKKILYPEKRIGHIPGINIGHQFNSRCEMVAVGLHSHWLNGIDYIGQFCSTEEYKNYTFPIAVAIVLSGMYGDDLDNAEEVVYTGQGGHNLCGDKRQIKDQVLQRGNLALKNCVEQSVPVRVIRGHENSVSYTGRIFTYDGLYKVTEYRAEKGLSGFTVYKFRLRRLEGQPILNTKQVQFTNGSVPELVSEISRLVYKDITGGQEDFPIPAMNSVDDSPVAPTASSPFMEAPHQNHSPVPLISKEVPSGLQHEYRKMSETRTDVRVRSRQHEETKSKLDELRAPGLDDDEEVGCRKKKPKVCKKQTMGKGAGLVEISPQATGTTTSKCNEGTGVEGIKVNQQITSSLLSTQPSTPPPFVAVGLGGSSSNPASKIVSEMLQLPHQEGLKVVQGLFNKGIEGMIKTLVEGQSASSTKAKLEEVTTKMYAVEGKLLDLKKERDDAMGALNQLKKKVTEDAEQMAELRKELEQVKNQHNQAVNKLKMAKEEAVMEWKNSDEYANNFKDYYWGDLTKRIVPLIKAWFQLEKADKGWPEEVDLDLSWISLDRIKDATSDINARRKIARAAAIEAECQARRARGEESEEESEEDGDEEGGVEHDGAGVGDGKDGEVVNLHNKPQS